MKWFIFAIIAVAILVVFGAVYAISHLVSKRKQPKYKTTAPDDDPKFLRDLAQKLKDQPQPSTEAQPTTGAQPTSTPEPDTNAENTDGEKPAQGEDDRK